jgi:DNA-binding NarL/FixJ family response regulator
MSHPIKVILAEDDADDRHFLQDFLQDRKDLKLLCPAENGVALMQFLDNITQDAHLPDVIILDQNMPKRNGLQTLRLLKATARYAHTPVLIYSTYTDDRLVQECLQAGAALVLPKPSDKAGYNTMIDAFLAAL